MSDATLLARQRILDPAYFTPLRSVPIFREHEIVQRDKKTGKVIRRVEVDKKKLQEIAEVNNRREAETGDLAPVTIGHTRKDDKGRPLPAQQQPPVVAYARNFRVGEFGPKKIPAILADFYIRKGCEQELNKYPRRSPEFWDGENFFDPIALLGAQTPQLDLGLVFYSRPADGRIYARGEDDMADMNEGASAALEMPKTDIAPAEEEGQHEQYMKHCYGHPYAKQYHDAMVKKYAMPAEGSEAGAPDNPPPMDADAMPYARSAAENVQIAQLTAAVQQLRKELTETRQESKVVRDQSLQYARQAQEKDVEARLTVLTHEGYDFDAKVELARLLPLNAQQRDEALAYMRKTYRNREEPIGNYAVPTSRTPPNGEGDDGWKEVEPGVEGPKHAEAAIAYMKTSEGRRECGNDYRKAVQVVAEKRKNGTLQGVR